MYIPWQRRPTSFPTSYPVIMSDFVDLPRTMPRLPQAHLRILTPSEYNTLLVGLQGPPSGPTPVGVPEAVSTTIVPPATVAFVQGLRPDALRPMTGGGSMSHGLWIEDPFEFGGNLPDPDALTLAVPAW
jgi:hypothetical protein